MREREERGSDLEKAEPCVRGFRWLVWPCMVVFEKERMRREEATVVLERNEEREVVGRIWGEERKNQYKIKCYFFLLKNC